jgi:hypothetical protein
MLTARSKRSPVVDMFAKYESTNVNDGRWNIQSVTMRFSLQKPLRLNYFFHAAADWQAGYFRHHLDWMSLRIRTLSEWTYRHFISRPSPAHNESRRTFGA